MVRIMTKFDDSRLLELISDPLHGLPRETHDICNVRHRRPPLLQSNRSNYLPARACQTYPGDERIA